MPYDFSTFDRNCAAEQPTPIDGTLTGSLPPWLRGSIILNGPGQMKFGEQEYNHVFDGAAILQKIEFTETGAQYSSKFLKSAAFLLNSENEQIIVSEFGTKGSSATNKTALKKLSDKFSFDKMFSDNAQISVVKYGSDLYAITESPFVHKICPKTLDTLKKFDLHKELGINSQCAHPMQLSDGSCINVLHNVGATGPRYDILKFPSDNPPDTFPKPTKIGSIDARWKLNPCHMHSFGMTQNYVILAEQPLTIDVKAMVTNTVREKPFIDGMEWIKEKLVKFHVVNKDTGKELKFRIKSESFFFLHIINSFEEDNHIVMDLCSFTKPEMIHSFYVKNIRENGETLWKDLDKGCVRRLVIPLSVNDKAAPEENLVTLSGSKAKAHRQKDGVVLLIPDLISPICYESPSVHPDFIGKKYSYFYGASSDTAETQGKAGKIDLRTGEVKTWGRDGVYTCVVNFIPRPGASPDSEEDGALVVTCIHGGQDRSKLSVAILDPATMNELAMVSFATPSDAPRALHGYYHKE